MDSLVCAQMEIRFCLNSHTTPFTGKLALCSTFRVCCYFGIPNDILIKAPTAVDRKKNQKSGKS